MVRWQMVVDDDDDDRYGNDRGGGATVRWCRLVFGAAIDTVPSRR